ncbi:WxL domain-containing protein [Lapidilactobacillus wuchangensis]|uniref:WxL domain-containing protein n=1 Tax=Lapidilactobacillus wuchangensis TaxID=2486001 RepID=UPI000F76765A|nr:WxL domain-containing protein [Lapidilactobacillus wuchangensis]
MKKTISLLALSLAIVGSLAFTGSTAQAASISADQLGGSSTADFKVTAKEDPEDPDPDPDAGKLVLNEVPDFNFGIISAKNIYGGFTGRAATADGKVSISDNRIGATDWTLKASMTGFTDGTTTLSDSVLNLQAAGQTTALDLNGAINVGTQTQLATSDGTAHGTFDYNLAAANNTLNLGANGGAVLTDGATYTSNLTWELTSGQPTTQVAE